MIDFSKPVPMSLIIETVGVIFAVIAAGVFMVKQVKRKKERV